MKKVLIILLLALLSSCTFKSEYSDKSAQYIKPLNDSLLLFDELNDEYKEIYLSINDDKDIENYILKATDGLLPENTLKDINGGTVNLSDYKNEKLILEVVAYWCPHCKQQAVYTENLLKIADDIKFIQYFKDGDKQLIEQFYGEAGLSIPDNIIIIPEDNDFTDALMEFEPQYIPSFFFFDRGRLSYIKISEFSIEDYALMKDYIFGDNSFRKDRLLKNDGTSIFEDYRTYNEVFDSFSFESKDKLALLNDSEDITVSTVGKKVEFNVLYEKEKDSEYSINSFDKYTNKELVVFYLAYIDESIKDDIKLINEFKDKHQDLNILTILVDSKDISTSEIYKNLDEKLKCDVLSSQSEIPQIFVDTFINTYPCMLFIQDNIICGGFYGLDSLSKMEFGYKTFLGENSISLIKNN